MKKYWTLFIIICVFAGTVAGKESVSSFYIQAKKKWFPMNNTEIRDIRIKLDETERAVNKPIKVIEPRARSESVTLSVDEGFPKLLLHTGYASVVTFSDITGQPWPVSGLVNGNSDAFLVEKIGKENSNMVSFSPLKNHVTTNMVVSLAGHAVPVTLEVTSGHEVTDYRLDIQVAARSPFAVPEPEAIDILSMQDDKSILSFLDGIAPEDSLPLRSSHESVEGWLHQNQYVVRTRGHLISPAYSKTLKAITGIRVYVTETIPVMRISFNGKVDEVTFHE